MRADTYAAKARQYLDTLCSVHPNRRTGSSGNRAATEFFAHVVQPFGYNIDVTPFPCLDHVRGEAYLAHQGRTFDVIISPYSLGCDVQGELVAVSTEVELARGDCAGKILLMRGEISSEQLMPKNFVFYNPERHQRIVSLLEAKRPAAIITATARQPEQVGALYPFPLIVDGDFCIPNVHCTDTVGDGLAELAGQVFRLLAQGERQPSTAANVLARLNPDAVRKVIVTAHIDAYEDSPGALDNASGTAVLLLLAEVLSGYDGALGIEIVALNGEDHYSAGGQMDYLRRYGDRLDRVLLAINIDDAGYREGNTAYSFYSCSPELEGHAEAVFRYHPSLARGAAWYNGDHMVFVQRGVPSIAFTSACMAELMRTVTHTPLDLPHLVDPFRLVQLAHALDSLIRSLEGAI